MPDERDSVASLIDDPDRYARVHLGYDLRCLLVAATTWFAVEEPFR